MKKGTHQLSQRLLERIYTADVLKQVSEALEDTSQNTTFKDHATNIVTDPNLTDSQKQTQLLYLVRGINVPVLYEFFTDELSNHKFWLFNSDKTDYFDKFVQEFQLSTKDIKMVFLSTAIPLSFNDLRQISISFSDSLGFHVIINHEVNSAILGGVQVKLENYIYDYSLRAKFRQFQKQWLSSLETIESAVGRNQS